MRRLDRKTLMKYFTLIAALTPLLVSPAFSANESNYTYLALGDSVPFGMNITLVPPYSNQLPTPSEFIGYPDVVAELNHLLIPGKEVNAACPGETSSSFLSLANLATNPDNGCNSPHQQPPPLPPLPPFKTAVGLHTNYTVAQMDFAEAQFQANKHINLVTLNIGANDVLLILPALEACGTNTTCAQNVLTPVLQTYGANLAQILSRIRANYQGTLILMTYYSPAPALDSLTTAVNGVMVQVVAQLSAQPNFAPITFADAFTAFQVASAPFNHDACQAGLLIKLPPSPFNTSPCDVHPSALGRDLLAATVELSLLFKH
jgi:lysophospholipase L1-like esterase